MLKPLIEITLPFYKEQKICIPNFNEIHNLFHNNEYDRVMCSTEGIMGLVGLYLKKAYSVKAYFYVHTDWVMFARKVWGIDSSNLNRLRRILRAFYGGFDKLFVLNSDHKKWLMGREMEFDEEKVCQTAHWVDKRYYPRHQSKENIFDLNETDKVLLFVGRLSSEKGVFDIAEIYQNLISTMPDLKLVFAGSGPAQEELQKRVPQALFMGWVDNEKLAQIYSAADLLLLPSRFDTFGCVVLEAMSCGLPVVAYKSKGPKDIIKHLQCGYLVSSKKEMQYSIQDFF